MMSFDEIVKRNADYSYEVRDDHVQVGASLGKSSAWVVGKATGAIQKVYSLRLDHDVFWSTVVTYGSHGRLRARCARRWSALRVPNRPARGDGGCRR